MISRITSSHARHLVLYLALTGLCPADESALAPPTNLDERVDIPAELQGPIDLERARLGEEVVLKVLREVRINAGSSLPKGAKLTAKLTFIQPRPLPLSNAHAAMALLINQGSWKEHTIPLRGYLWGPIRSQEHYQHWSIHDEARREELSRIGRTHADPVIGSVIEFEAFQIAPPDCILKMREPRCAKQVLQTGSTLLIRHLPSRYQLALLYDDNAYATARVMETRALGGSRDAAFEIAQKQHDGDLYIKDDAQALGWLRLAAEAGHPAAQTNLAVFLASGVGTTPDLVSAYKWFSISASRGVQQNQAALTKLEQVLSPEQVAEGRQLAAHWLKAHPKEP